MGFCLQTSARWAAAGFIFILHLVFIHGDRDCATVVSDDDPYTSLKPSVTRYAFGNGFHRDLLLNVHVENRGQRRTKSGCFLLLEDVLPRDIYVDPYQITRIIAANDREQHNDVRVVLSPGTVDVESLAEDTTEDQVLRLLVVVPEGISPDAGRSRQAIVTNFSLPIHFRYQKAAFGNIYVDVHLKNPDVYLRCEEKLPCDQRIEIVSNFCNAKDGQQCLWMKYKPVESSASLHFRIPRGDLNDRPLVVFITSVVVGFGVLYLLRAVIVTRMPHYKRKSK